MAGRPAGLVLASKPPSDAHFLFRHELARTPGRRLRREHSSILGTGHSWSVSVGSLGWAY